MTGLRERLAAEREAAWKAHKALYNRTAVRAHSFDAGFAAALGVLGDQDTLDLIADVVTQWQVGDALHAQWIDAAEAHKIAAAVVAALTEEQT